MKITCPHCEIKNDIEFSENIKCRCCEKSFTGYSFSIRKITKPIMAGASALLVTGGIIGYKVENSLDQIRYSPKFEYAIINQCANPNNRYLSNRELERNIEICSCTLEKTIKEVGYKNEIDNELIDSFTKNLVMCNK
ncbi:hypothetical protein BKK51_10820 [Rodentibacter trehalosifermentans]|uniref:Uncharacterized protein n=1 Tax=Rodentibacter trehalosifermentans TaxID=1908263 RepID=A0A1V3INF7_9PAST|nr:hypothetical protein [Rodentibacter trehalosifermentans]OOF43802.1 hypothetical protein BKK51_10820 [Rodentibacter trehalosifermentans]